MKRALLISVVAVAVLVGAGGFVYAFGTPQAPDVAAPAAVPGAAAGLSPEEATAPQVSPVPPTEPGDGSSTMGGGDPSARGKKAPPADPSAPLALEIPGCVCHSDDPKLVEEHAGYRMNQCAGCHVGGTPTGQE
ncbi:MAG: hypothetical protein U1E26_02145 [Coriobacteriia bacterium]|nr:hypothetical protein [Coriobacteriia bacterium]